LGFYGYLSYNKYQSNIAELSDYPLITQNYDNTNSNFQKLLSAKQGLEKDLSKGKELKSNSISSYTLFKEISQAVPSKVVLVGIRTSEENYNELVVEGQAVDDNPIIQLIDALNSRDTVQKASLVNMSVETMMSKSGQTSREIKVFEISVIANDEVINNLDSSGDE
jgi:Tfp pilus assembly protein PilN